MLKEPLLGINISICTFDQFVDAVIAKAKGRISSYICVANVHMLVEARNNTAFSKTVNGADLCAADGLPLTWGLNLINTVKQERICGMDLLPALLSQCAGAELPVLFYGGTDEMLRSLTDVISTRYPKLRVTGAISPPFRAMSEAEVMQDVNVINESGAALVFVCLGCPKQEKWMASMKGKVNAPMIGVGGAVPVLAGVQTRAPKWMQGAGLEWLFRLSQEPKRLFRRYAITNSIFLAAFVKQLVRVRLLRS